jgi:SAM-dependent methyltransferase
VTAAAFSLWREIGRQFRRPEGLGGLVMGRVMEAINRAPNREAIAALDIAPADVVVELGYGPGCAIEALARRASLGRIYGADPSAAMFAAAARRNREAIASSRVVLTQGQIQDLRLNAETVDKILGVNVVYFFDVEGGELREARRLLKPGGKLALYATDESVMRRWKFVGADTHRLFGRDDLALLLARAGFAPDEIVIRDVEVALGVAGLVAVATKQSDGTTGTRVALAPLKD